MPWKVFSEGDQYCVHKLTPDGSKGKKVACHASRSEAESQMRALYANEKGLFGNSNVVHSQPQLAHLTVKEVGDQLRWIAHYSNNVRDNDNPPEILSAEGHHRFVYLVDKGYVPYPELWVWHEPSWRLGPADWMAVDEIGLDGKSYVFSVASGYFFEETKEVGYALADIDDIAMSHGMYKDSIERDPADSSIITGFVSGEITLLPRMYAANKLTDYMAGMRSKEDMTVSTEKRKELNRLWPGLGDEVLDIMEARNKERAEKAADMELEIKESEGAETETETEEGVAEKETTETGDGQTTNEDGGEEAARESETEQKGVDVEMLASALVAINERLTAVEKAASEAEGLSEVQKQLEEIGQRLGRVEKSIEDRTPMASQVADILAGNSVVGKEETKVDGRSKLGKDAPDETKSEGEEVLFFMDWARS